MLLEWCKTRIHSDTILTIGNQDEVGLNETWTGSVSGTWLKVKSTSVEQDSNPMAHTDKISPTLILDCY
jgi:hypothetical protein